MRCVILQPSYLPWRGYFDLIHRADLFVFYDDVQHDKRGWRNRNRVKSPSGTRWLTVPVHARGAQIHHTPIHQVRIDNEQGWRRKHWATLTHCYAHAPWFAAYRSVFEPFYSVAYEFLADLAIDLVQTAARELGIRNTAFIRSSSLGVAGRKTDRLLAILREVRADVYLSGPAAREYLEERKLNECGIGVEWMQYQYREYPQLYPPYDPFVSILDLLFMTGPQAPRYIWAAEPASPPAPACVGVGPGVPCDHENRSDTVQPGIR